MDAEAEALGLSRLLIVVSPSLRRGSELGASLESLLCGRAVAVFDGVEPNNPESVVARAIDSARSAGIDGVVSIGGGATHDLAKAVALAAPSGHGIRDFITRFEPPGVLVPPSVRATPLPVLAMPSTFSAAEMLAGGVVTDAASGRKQLFFHPALAPKRVFLDGEVAATTPRPILAMSGLNALHHCIEALYSKGRSPVADAFALRALRELFDVLPAFGPRRAPPGPADFQRAIEASALSGLSYANSSLGVGHAVCHVLGGRFGLSHAAANAVVLPISLRYNLDWAIEALAGAALALGERISDGRQAALTLAGRVDALCETLGAPRRLRDIGLARSEVGTLARESLADWLTATNPRPLDLAELTRALDAAW